MDAKAEVTPRLGVEDIKSGWQNDSRLILPGREIFCGSLAEAQQWISTGRAKLVGKRGPAHDAGLLAGKFVDLGGAERCFITLVAHMPSHWPPRIPHRPGVCRRACHS